MAMSTTFDEQAIKYDTWFEKHPDLHLAELEGLLIKAGFSRFAYPCPHFSAIKGAVEKRLGTEAKIIDWTH